MVKLSLNISILALLFAVMVHAHFDAPSKRHHSGTAAARRRAAIMERGAEIAPPQAPKRSIVKRRKGGRCSARTSTVLSVSSSTASFTSPSAPTSSPARSVVPGNVGAVPKSSKTPVYQAPTTTAQPKPPATSHAYTPPKPTSAPISGGGGSGNGNSGGGGGGGGGVNALLVGTKSGQGTYYGTGLGSCGITSQDTDYIAAVSHILYDSFPGAGANPNLNPICGRTVTAHYQGKSVNVKIVDRCVGCAEWDLDFSPSAFSQIADQALGRIDITWTFDSTSL